MKDTESCNGTAFVLFAAAIYSLSTPFSKPLDGILSFQQLAGLLYFGSGLGAVILGIVTPRSMISSGHSLTVRDFRWMSGGVIFGGIFAPLLLLIGLQSLPASSTSLLLNFEAVFTILVAWIVFREQINRRFATGAFAILVGSALVSWNGFAAVSDIRGALMIVIACLCWGVENNFLRKIAHRNPFQIAGIRGFLAGGANLLFSLMLPGNWTVEWVLVGLLIGIFCYGFSNVFWVLGLRYLGSARAGAYFSSAPFIGAFASVLFLHEPVTAFLLAAFVAMGLGVWILWSEVPRTGK
ncbi:MAG TPA: DMT family transporter [Candidatus Acidoferrales bacterium]|nr:DMT family transporter [Candidatus Acidoferrales bacterium]